jgi:hypothetical protein
MFYCGTWLAYSKMNMEMQKAKINQYNLEENQDCL